MAGHVFISYTSSDRAQAIALADALEAQGVPVWIDRRSIEGGANWNAAIVRGIKDCAVFLVVGSARAFGSPNVQRELNLAVDENKPLLPLLLEQVTPPDEVRYALAGRQWLDARDGAQEAWLPRVLSAIKRLR